MKEPNFKIATINLYFKDMYIEWLLYWFEEMYKRSMSISYSSDYDEKEKMKATFHEICYRLQNPTYHADFGNKYDIRRI